MDPEQTPKEKSAPEVIKRFSCSTQKLEHKKLIAHRYGNIKNLAFFRLRKAGMLFFPLINV